MIEELLSIGLPSASSLFGGGTGYVEPGVVSLSTLFSGAGAVILGEFTGSAGALTLPMNFAALFVGAMMANWAFSGLALPMDQHLQPMLITFGGMLIGAFSMLWCIKSRAVR